MLDIQCARINTAGAYVSLNGLYVFTIGIHPHNGHIPVIRLGGHREENETGWQCTVREVYEEASLQIKALKPQTTYFCDWDHLETELQMIQWQHETDQDPTPFLVITYCREAKSSLSIMYHAEAEGIPTPSSEVQGLLLLEEEEIHHLCRGSVTLEQYLERGGKAILNAEFDKNLPLEPFAQIRLLSGILNAQTASQADREKDKHMRETRPGRIEPETDVFRRRI